jgi:hypothetical protein
VALDQEDKPAFHLLLGYGGEAAEIVVYAFDLLMLGVWGAVEQKIHLSRRL